MTNYNVCIGFFAQWAGSLHVVAKLLVDHNGNVFPLRFFIPAVKTLLQKLDKKFHLTSDTHHLKQQRLALIPTRFSFVAKNNVISKVVSAKCSSDSDYVHLQVTEQSGTKPKLVAFWIVTNFGTFSFSCYQSWYFSGFFCAVFSCIVFVPKIWNHILYYIQFRKLD